jgi:GTP cyclohydrolase I
MYASLLVEDRSFAFTTFPSESSDLVVVRDIPFVSFCAHHFLPFTGAAHIGYVPNGQLVGLSKLPRTVHEFAGKPQVQEQLTTEIADALVDRLNPVGVAVILEACHECMEIRGAWAVGAITHTSAFRGALESAPLYERFLASVHWQED